MGTDYRLRRSLARFGAGRTAAVAVVAGATVAALAGSATAAAAPAASSASAATPAAVRPATDAAARPPGGGSALAVRLAQTVRTGRAALAVTIRRPAWRPAADVYARYAGIPRADIWGVRPGSLHAAYLPSARTEWLTASFLPVLRAPQPILVRFQDGASTVLLTRRDGGQWHVVRAGGEPLSCPGAVPAAIQRAWRRFDRAGCAAASPMLRVHRHQRRTQVPPMNPPPTIQAQIGLIAQQNIGIGDNPASTYFGFDCDPYTTLVGVYVSAVGCGTDPRFGVLDENELWCADFAKWVWEQGGVRSDLSTLTPAASSFYFWGQQHGEHMRTDGRTPERGDAVVFYPSTEQPGASFADHVGLVVGVNRNGTVNLVNGDFMGMSNITVQADPNVRLRPWAADIWGKGEKWVFVYPAPRHHR